MGPSFSIRCFAEAIYGVNAVWGELQKSYRALTLGMWFCFLIVNVLINSVLCVDVERVPLYADGNWLKENSSKHVQWNFVAPIRVEWKKYDPNMPPTDKILLILDLDETLLHASVQELDRPPDLMVDRYFVYKRPYLAAFLEEVKKHFHLAIWSSASDSYVEEVTSRVLPDPNLFQFIWGGSRCTYRRNFEPEISRTHRLHYTDHYHYIKPLKKVKRLGFDLRRMLIVDDSPHKVAGNYGNAIYPKPYEGEAHDHELKLLSTYLQTLKDKSNVLSIEKRGWRQKTIANFPGLAR